MAFCLLWCVITLIVTMFNVPLSGELNLRLVIDGSITSLMFYGWAVFSLAVYYWADEQVAPLEEKLFEKLKLVYLNYLLEQNAAAKAILEKRLKKLI
jgi:hypothetical protein